MIKYDIDTTENEYTHFDGNSIEELKEFLYPNSAFKACCGTIEIEWICADSLPEGGNYI